MLRAVSLFSGAGGMDLVRQAGFRVPAGVSWTPIAAPACGPTPSPGPGCWRPTSGPSAPRRSGTSWGCGRASLISRLGAALPAVLPDRQAGRGRRPPRLAAVRAVRFAAALRPKAIFVEQVKAARPRLRPAAGGLARPRLRADPQGAGRGADYGVPSGASADRGRGARRRPAHPARPDPRRPGCAPSSSAGPPGLAGGRPGSTGRCRTAATWTDLEASGGGSLFVPEGQRLAASSRPRRRFGQRLTRKDTTKFRRLACSAPSLTLRCGEIFPPPGGPVPHAPGVPATARLPRLLLAPRPRAQPLGAGQATGPAPAGGQPVPATGPGGRRAHPRRRAPG